MSEERRAKDRRPGERRTAPRASRPGSRASYAAHAAEGVRPTRHAGEEKRPVRRPVSYTHLRAHETGRNLVCRLLLEKKNTETKKKKK